MVGEKEYSRHPGSPLYSFSAPSLSLCHSYFLKEINLCILLRVHSLPCPSPREISKYLLWQLRPFASTEFTWQNWKPKSPLSTWHSYLLLAMIVQESQAANKWVNIQFALENVWKPIYMQNTFSVCACVCVLVTQSCPTLCDPLDCSLPSSSVHGILQVSMLEWVAIPFSRGSSDPGPHCRQILYCLSGQEVH